MEDSSQVNITCPKCGSKVEPTDRFCTGCGTSIPQTAAAPLPPVTPPGSSPAPKPQRKVGLIICMVVSLVLLLVAGGAWLFIGPFKSHSPAAREGTLVVDPAGPKALPAKAGNQPDDAGFTIDGKEISGLTAEQLDSLLRGEGGAVRTITTNEGGSRTVITMPQRPGDPQSTKADEHFQTGIAFAEDGKWSQAEAEYREAVRLNPALDDCWHALGEACLEQKKWPDAVTAYQQAVRLQPSFGIYHADLAVALLRQGRRTEATKAAQEAIRLQETDHPVYKELGLMP